MKDILPSSNNTTGSKCLVLSVYSAHTFKEFYLPALIDENYEICLSREDFHIQETVAVLLEAINGIWYMRNDKNLISTIRGGVIEQMPLSNGDKFRIGQWITILVSVANNSVRSFAKIDMRNHPKICVGRGSDNLISYTNDSEESIVSKNHCCLLWDDSKGCVIDTSSNGTFVNGERITLNTRHSLLFGDTIDVFGLKMVFLEGLLAVDNSVSGVRIGCELVKRNISTTVSERKLEKRDIATLFKRSPRVVGELIREPYDIEGPTTLQRQRKQPLLLTIGPSFTMIIPMLLGTAISLYSQSKNSSGSPSLGSLTGLVVVGAAGLFAVMWALLRVKNQKKVELEEKVLRESQYGSYLSRICDELQRQVDYNRNVLFERYPSAETVIRYPMNVRSKLWNRNSSHEDFLYVRLGLGDVPFQSPINVPKDRFSLIDDKLAERPREIKEEFSFIHDAPIGIDLLDKRLIGIFGSPNKERALYVARLLAVQVAGCNCYTDVRMVLLCEEREQEVWEFAKWLPHVWSEDRKIRYMAANKKDTGDVLFALSSVLRDRAETVDSITTNKTVFKPHYIFIISDMTLIENETISKYLLQPGKDIGVTTIVISSSYEDLPNYCNDLIQIDDSFTGMYNVSTMEGKRNAVKFDELDSEVVDSYARELSDIRVNEDNNDGDIPNSITFFDMYGFTTFDEFNVKERWRKNRTYENMRALIGKKAGGVDVYLDINEKYHGPHGLVAGTTGSGKSETLQTYILSLAVSFSPSDIGFFIIDFKGGGMANLFSELPHTLGTITNLSGNAVRRAMVSIKSEMTRRQRIFAEYEVNHLDKYTRLYKAKEARIPIPHLLIIVDEFAELKREEPDFMRELVSVAQVGRSLGVHLILSTQKPAGVVDDNIWSNSRFKLCLRVQDKQDSNDMLKKPDAAYITQTGRCYMQVGNDELYELFQSGWSGAPFDEKISTMRHGTATLVSMTGKRLEGKKRNRVLKEKARRDWILGLVRISLRAIRESTTNDGLDQSSLIKEIFRLIVMEKIDFPYNDYNATRINELLTIITRVNQTKQYTTVEQLSDAVISEADKTMVRLPERVERTQLAAMVDYLKGIASETGTENKAMLWLPLLPQTLYLKDLTAKERMFDGRSWSKSDARRGLYACVGLCDDPINQSQFPISVNIERDGNILLCGMATSGKSTLAQTMIYSFCSKYAPDIINFYIIDYSTKMLLAFESAPHVGGVITEDDNDRLNKFFVMIDKELSRRKSLFKGGSYSQYIHANGIVEPAIICVIDGYANFREKTENAFDGKLRTLILNGPNFGIYFVVVSIGLGGGDVQSYIVDNVKSVFALEMGDKYKYTEVLRNARCELLPESNIKGRGMTVHEGRALEFQGALCIRADNDFSRSEAIRKGLTQMSNAWNGITAKQIPEIPANADWSDFTSLAEYAALKCKPQHLAFSYDIYDASPYSLDLTRNFTFLIAGKAHSGKTNILKALILAANDKDNSEIVILDKINGDLRGFSNSINAVYNASVVDYNNYGKRLVDEVVRRNTRMNELSSLSYSGSKKAEAIRNEFKALYIFIADFTDFVERLYNPAPGSIGMSGFYENTLSKAADFNIYFITTVDLDNVASVAGRRAYQIVVSRKYGLLAAGPASSQNLLDFSTIPFKEQTRSHSPGIALIPPYGTHGMVKVHVPLVNV